jgi:ribokinase
MDVINIGSLNLDWVYQVPHFVQPGETLSAHAFNEYVGGKGLNQSIALARAGCAVAHVGAIGHNGDLLLQALKADGVNTDFVTLLDGPSGHAIIQVSPQGENAIVLFPGSNEKLTINQIKQALTHFSDAKSVLLQNETNASADIMHLAKEAGKILFYNPAPMLPRVNELPLHLVDVLILNETEAEKLHCESLIAKHPDLIVVITEGEKGVTVLTHGKSEHYPAVHVERVIDTTAAGDTFIGYFMAEYLQTQNIPRAVSLATRAASLCIQQAGAAQSIPKLMADEAM